MNEGEGSGGEARAMERDEERTILFAPSFFFSTPFLSQRVLNASDDEATLQQPDEHVVVRCARRSDDGRRSLRLAELEARYAVQLDLDLLDDAAELVEVSHVARDGVDRGPGVRIRDVSERAVQHTLSRRLCQWSLALEAMVHGAEQLAQVVKKASRLLERTHPGSCRGLREVRHVRCHAVSAEVLVVVADDDGLPGLVGEHWCRRRCREDAERPRTGPRRASTWRNRVLSLR